MIGNQSCQFDIRMPLGSLSGWQMTMYQADQISPFIIAGHTFEYVVYDSPFGASPAPSLLVKLRSDAPGSPTPAGAGLLTVLSTLTQSSVNLSIYPPATLPLSPNTYFHALWMDYADPVNKLNLWWGQLMLDPTAQP